VETGSGGDLGKNAGAGAGSLSGAIIGGASGGPLGAVAGAVAGGMLGAAAGNAAKDMGGDPDDPNVVPATGAHASAGSPGLGPLPGTIAGTPSQMGMGTGAVSSEAPIAGFGTGGLGTGTDLTPGNNIPGVQTGGVTTAGTDTRGVTEKAADALTGDRVDDKTGGVVAGAGTGAPAMSSGSSLGTATESNVMRVPVAEEHLQVGKEMRQTGEVEVSKHVVEEQVQVPVTLRHEEVVVTRHEVDRPVTGGEAVMGESEVIRVPVHEEVAHVTKEARVAEEIEIQKRAVSQQQTVSDTVRREVVDVNQPTIGTATGLSTGTVGGGTLGTGTDLTPGNNVPGVQTGGTNADGSPDTRGLTEKAADALTGDNTDDKTGRRI